jgi:formate dehydrogenase (NADP+) alpha subunit
MKPVITLTVDNQTITVEEGSTILEALLQNSISIPHLCSYPDLEPYGACRLCIVEVDGMRGFPTACTTPAANGMVVRTKTPEVDGLRRDTLQLLLSEHPSSCLFCPESTECLVAMKTTRKGEAVTGCRSCPKDCQCELQDVVQQVGLEGTDLPFHYRDLPVERYDPFYDRDYNLCILCGRCVRVCHEVRLADVLTFKQRGQDTLIGPAYQLSHIEAGCEFCGDCVTVCPTGALSEKTLKWAGIPDSRVTTTCAFCSLGCQIDLLIKEDEVLGSQPVADSMADQNQLCVKGRFAACELLNNPHRLTHPLRLREGREQKIHWEEAIQAAVEALSQCSPEGFGLRISADCTTEDLYVARKFTQTVMHSENISSQAVDFYGTGFSDFAGLMLKAGKLSSIGEAATIFSIGLEGRYGEAVVALALKKAVKDGARLFTAFPREHSLSQFAHSWLALDGKTLLATLQELVLSVENQDSIVRSDLVELVLALRDSRPVVIVLGPEYLHGPFGLSILRAVADLVSKSGAIVLPLAPQSNLSGALRVGIFNGLLKKQAGSAKNDLKVLYLIGETPSPLDPPADFLLYQNFASSDSTRLPDLVLPSAAFSEVDGTFTNLEGKTVQLHKAVNPPGDALPDWVILCKIAQKMGFSGFDYPNSEAILKEMRTQQAEAPREPIIFRSGQQPDENSGGSTQAPLPEDVYKGFPLSTWVEGLRSLQSET